MREVIFVVKDVKKTNLMQHFDVFERFKFIGRLLKTQQESKLAAKELLEKAKTHSDDSFALVGVIIPDADAAFLPEVKVYSNGTQWITIEELCKSSNSLMT